MKKIYCGDCAYYQERQYVMIPEAGYWIPEECLKEEEKEIDTYKCRMDMKSHPSEINRNNDCKDFERKK